MYVKPIAKSPEQEQRGVHFRAALTHVQCIMTFSCIHNVLY